MWTLALQLVFIGLNLQVSSCYQSCTLNHGLIAKCSSQQHEWVPLLPRNITHLFLEFNYISEINSSSLRAYDQLIKLDLGSQYVPLVIRSNSFLRQRKLIRLVLGNNTGLQLELRSFAGLYNLQQLVLDHCHLTESILAESYLQPLLSLQTLNLFGNRIVRLRPGPFFSRLTKLTELNLKLNRIERLCEEDLAGFRGKNFAHLNLNSNSLYKTYCGDFDWESCGNPFRGMAFNVLDLSSNGICMKNLPRFFKSIEGTPINHLIFSGHLGKDFSHDNLHDPDKNTFEGLMNSSVNFFDLSKNRIFALKMAVFSPLKNVRTIDISNNKINQIKRNAFNGLQGHLRNLNLSYNLLGEIHDYTFTNLTNLRSLNLSHNYIGVLGHNAFKDLPELVILDLTGNSLRDLDFPASLPNLQFLLLADNKLKSLYYIDVLGINSIYVDISDNRLNSLGDVYIILSHFPHLQYFLYGGNIIKWCSHSEVSVHGINSWNSLKVLDLHDSSLQIMWMQGQCLDLFDHLENLLGLNLTFNSLTTLPQGIFSGLRSVIEIDLSFNELTYLQTDVFPASLLRLYLTSNFLASPDPTTFQSIIFLSLEANRFHCDCHLESFLKWLKVTNVTFLSSVEEFRCEFPAAFRNRPLLNYSTIVEPCEQDDEKAVQGLKLALFIFSALSIIMVVFSGIVYARLRGHIFIIYKKIAGRVLEGPKPTIPVNEMQYDAYFCFSDSDYRWVEAALLKKLDNQFSEENIFHCCFEARDFLPGEDHLSNIRDAIWGSRKTVCIVSKEFLKDGWCLEAFALAQGRMLEELTNVLILLVVGKLAHYQLMKCKAIRAFVQRREYLTWPEDPQDLEWFYERLVSQMLKDTKVKKLAEDKPEPEPEPEPEPVQPDVQPENEEDGIELQNIRAIAL